MASISEEIANTTVTLLSGSKTFGLSTLLLG
jgi:bifunctional pyridoxal-dependent enzyme with beta-cystathionase and maltose regulon repressor activities